MTRIIADAAGGSSARAVGSSRTCSMLMPGAYKFDHAVKRILKRKARGLNSSPSNRWRVLVNYWLRTARTCPERRLIAATLPSAPRLQDAANDGRAARMITSPVPCEIGLKSETIRCSAGVVTGGFGPGQRAAN